MAVNCKQDDLSQSKTCLPIAAVARTGGAVLFPATATRVRAYRLPGVREVNPDWGAALPITLVLSLSPLLRERGQDTRTPGAPG